MASFVSLSDPQSNCQAVTSISRCDRITTPSDAWVLILRTVNMLIAWQRGSKKADGIKVDNQII